MRWLIAKNDITAPPEPTIIVLRRLRKSGKPFETIVFPHSDHGLTEFMMRDGRRITTKYARGYFPTIIKWLGRQASGMQLHTR